MTTTPTQAERLTPLAALELVCGDLFERWDKDQRSGKLLTALSGMMSPGYDPRVDLIRTALASIGVSEPSSVTLDGLPGKPSIVDVPFIASGLETIADDYTGEPLCDYDRRILRRAASLLTNTVEGDAVTPSLQRGGEKVQLGTRCNVCGMHAPATLAFDCNRPECAYRPDNAALTPSGGEGGKCFLCVGKCRGHRLGHEDEWQPERGSEADRLTNTVEGDAVTPSLQTGGEGLEVSTKVEGFYVEVDDVSITTCWPDGRYVAAFADGKIVTGRAPSSVHGFKPTSTTVADIAALTPSGGEGETVPSTTGETVPGDEVREAWRALVDNLGSVEMDGYYSGSVHHTDVDHLNALLSASPPTTGASGEVELVQEGAPDNTYTPYGRRSVANLARLLGIAEQRPTVVSIVNAAYDEIVFQRALNASSQPTGASGEVEQEWLRGDWYERWQDATENADPGLMATLESLRVRVERTILAALSLSDEQEGV